MKQRHHRKARQRAMKANRPRRFRGGLEWFVLPRRTGKSRAMEIVREAFRRHDQIKSKGPTLIWFDDFGEQDDRADAFAYAAQAWRQMQDAMGMPMFDVSMAIDNRTANEIELQRADAERRLRNLATFGCTHPEFTVTFEPPEPTALELAAQHVVQQAELYDRSLPHGFHRGDPWEAIPHPHCMAASRTRYEELIEEQARQLGVATSEVRREARRYSTSLAYTHWLRENPPA